MTEETEVRFSSALPVIVLTRPAGQTEIDWQEIDRGPGYFSVPASEEVAIKMKGIDNSVLAQLVEELKPVAALRYLDLAENRNVTNEGVARLRALHQLEALNLSSCSITSTGLAPLKEIPKLRRLILSYCNKLTDASLKTIESMRSLEFVDLKGCLGLSQGGFSKMHRRNLTIHR